MFRNFHKQILFWPAVLVVGLVFGSALQIALAWTVPSVAPPGNNVAAPLNTSPTAQTKTGSLTVNGTGTYIRARSFSDLDNTTYYLNPNGSSYLNTADIGLLNVTTDVRALGGIYADLSMQSPVFIDNDDPDYFINSSDTSNLNNITMDGQLGLGLGGGSVEANRQIDSQGYIKSRTGFCIGSDCIDEWPSGGGSLAFGSWENKANDTTYHASTDGLVLGTVWCNCAGSGAGSVATGYTDGNPAPTTHRGVASANCTNADSFTMPVKSGDYWKVDWSTYGSMFTPFISVQWIPIISGGGGGGGGGGGAGITGEMTIYGSASCPTGWTQAYSGTAYALLRSDFAITDTKCYDTSGGAPPNSLSYGSCKVCLPESGTYVAYKGSGAISCASGWTSVYSGTAGFPSRQVFNAVNYHQAGDINCYQSLPAGAQAAGTCNFCTKGTSGSSYSYTYYCYNTNYGTPLCANAGGTQGYCPAGYNQIQSLGNWGSCYMKCPPRTVFASFTPLGYCGGGTGDYTLLPGGTCGVDHLTRVVGSAFICSK